MHPSPPQPPSGPVTGVDVDALWRTHRRRMLDIAYRMLGGVADAEDVAAEAYTRLLATDIAEIRDPVGWLVTVTARLCLDRLRSAEHRRRTYVGPWLPEPIVDTAQSTTSDPADFVTLDESVRMALLVVLEQLSPAERTSFVLHDLFGSSFVEVADIVGRSPAACRQLASRARRRIQAAPERPRSSVTSDELDAVARRFARACASGRIEPLLEILDPNVIGDFDSGGHVPGAPLRPLDGRRAVARVLTNAFREKGFTFSVTSINADPGVIALHGDVVIAAICLGVHDGRVDLIHAIGNPEKLRHLQPRATGEPSRLE